MQATVGIADSAGIHAPGNHEVGQLGEVDRQSARKIRRSGPVNGERKHGRGFPQVCGRLDLEDAVRFHRIVQHALQIGMRLRGGQAQRRDHHSRFLQREPCRKPQLQRRHAGCNHTHSARADLGVVGRRARIVRELDREPFAAQIYRSAAFVEFHDAIDDLVMPDRQVDHLLGPFAGTAVPGKIVRPVRVDHDMHAQLVHFDRRQIDFAFGERKDAEAQCHGFGTQQRRLSRRLGTMQHQRSHTRGKGGTTKGEAADFDPPSGGTLHLSDDSLADIFVEPPALHHDQASQRGNRQQHRRPGEHAQHDAAADPPARLSHWGAFIEKDMLSLESRLSIIDVLLHACSFQPLIQHQERTLIG
jgi:hypothetical protein